MNDRKSGERIGAPIDESEIDLVYQLWRSVIIQAVCDAKTKGTDERIRKAALKWLEAEEGQNSEFAEICIYAGLNFSSTRREIQKILADPNAVLDFRCVKREKGRQPTDETRKRYFRRVQRNARKRDERKKQIS